MKTVSNSK